MSRRSNPIHISRRMLALAVVVSGGLGVAAGELAASPAASQAHAVASSAPAACRSFATDVAGAIKDLSVVVGVEGGYALFIPRAFKDGQTGNASDYRSIGTQLESLVKRVLAENAAFQKVKGPLLRTEKQCLS
jgi:hypothetical protein